MEVMAETVSGWRYAFGAGLPEDFIERVVDAAQAGDGAAVGVWIFDSDYGQITGVCGDHRGTVALGRGLADGPLEHDPRAFAEWALCAPNPLSAEDIDLILSRPQVLAEETAEELLDRLGIREPYDPFASGEQLDGSPLPLPTSEAIAATGFAGYLAPLGSMQETRWISPIGEVSWRDLRHVPGVGEGFLGIWDRAAPEASPERFLVTARGEARLWAELERLQEPLVVEAFGATAFGGFLGPAGFVRDADVAGRDLAFRDARFVLGAGDGFTGIWDRKRPAAPIERFPTDFDGESSAQERVYELLFEEELAAKATPGVRVYHPPTRIVTVVDSQAPGDERPPRSARYGGYAWLIVEEDDDERWIALSQWARDGTGGRFHAYILAPSGFGYLARWQTLDEAKHFVSRVEHQELDRWAEVPPEVPRTLMATFQWAQRSTPDED